MVPSTYLESLPTLTHRAYNDMLYLIEKYAPLEGIERYDAEKDISVTGAYTDFEINQLE